MNTFWLISHAELLRCSTSCAASSEEQFPTNCVEVDWTSRSTCSYKQRWVGRHRHFKDCYERNWLLMFNATWAARAIPWQSVKEWTVPKNILRIQDCWIFFLHYYIFWASYSSFCCENIQNRNTRLNTHLNPAMNVKKKIDVFLTPSSSLSFANRSVYKNTHHLTGIAYPSISTPSRKRKLTKAKCVLWTISPKKKNVTVI